MGGKSWQMHGLTVSAVSDINSMDYDLLVIITLPNTPPPQALQNFIAAAKQLDDGLDKQVSVLPCPQVSGQRLVVSPIAALTAYDDVRSVYEASLAGMQRAVTSGARRPVLALQPNQIWPNAELVALLGALEALYVPLQIRESFPALAPHKLLALGVYSEGISVPLERIIHEAVAMEIARGVARDVGGADPERMTPQAAATLLAAEFAGSDVSVRVLDDTTAIAREYPLMAAVNRAAASVDRHRGCVIFLEYAPQNHDRTVMMVGKGVTYDTGGCNIKAGGVMYGMSHDKCGAAAVAAFLKACTLLKPNIKVVAALGMVRNSIGEEAYVADELIKSRLGLAVRVGNTDAEGRMVMGDLLAEMATRAKAEKNPHLYTVATLTGHVVRAYGVGYTAAMDNHVARRFAHSQALQYAGERVGDMIEVSTIRREDLARHRGKVAGDQVHQADNQSSSVTPRGHQAPAAFLLLVSGLDTAPLPYTHLDVAGAAGCMPHQPTAAPLLALAAFYGLLQTTQTRAPCTHVCNAEVT